MGKDVDPPGHRLDLLAASAGLGGLDNWIGGMLDAEPNGLAYLLPPFDAQDEGFVAQMQQARANLAQSMNMPMPQLLDQPAQGSMGSERLDAEILGRAGLGAAQLPSVKAALTGDPPKDWNGRIDGIHIVWWILGWIVVFWAFAPTIDRWLSRLLEMRVT